MLRRANALFNAVKKQYGLHSYLLPLELPSPPPPPVPVPIPPLRLPPIPQSSLLNTPNPPAAMPKSASISGPTYDANTLRMNEQDIQKTAKFVREFVSMSLVPWMEKCVADWNENVIPPSHILESYVYSCMLLVCFNATATLASFFLDSPSLWYWNDIACPTADTCFLRFPYPGGDSIFGIKCLCWGTSS